MSTSTILRLQDELRSSKEDLVKVSTQIKSLLERKRRIEKRVEVIKSELELVVGASSEGRSRFDSEDFPWSQALREKLTSVFNLKEFRSRQKIAINATLSGVDLLLVMPTGGGKSLCFQLPAILSDGVTLVVSPLISLMEDQLQSLQQLGICTRIFNAQTSKEETKEIFEEMISQNSKNKLRLLYVTPEKLAKSKRLMAQVEKMYRAGRFSRLVIDEVHCCSSWGHDFRQDYKFLGIMKTQYPQTPIIGLTATATAQVILDVQKMLNIESCLVLRDSFYRPNLHYSVYDYPPKEKIHWIAKLIKTRFSSLSGIIYCLSIKDCEEVSEKLKSEHGIRACRYHAQLDPEERTLIQGKWSRNQYQVIVATVAFGMGINKLDVRFVIHHSMSKSVENYYQETGRAGRDGERAECILFFNIQDSFRASCLMMTEKNGVRNVHNMLSYSLDSRSCRKLLIARHFGDECDEIEGESESGCGMCDNCDCDHRGRGEDVDVDMEMEVEVKAGVILSSMVRILEHAHGLDERMTAIKLMDALYGKGAPRLRVGDVPCPRHEREICERLLGRFIVEGRLEEDFHFTPYSTISYIVPGDVDDMEEGGGGGGVGLVYIGVKRRVLELELKGEAEAEGASKKTGTKGRKGKGGRKGSRNGWSHDEDEDDEDFMGEKAKLENKVKSKKVKVEIQVDSDD